MFIDKRSTLSDAQAFLAGATASTSYYDVGGDFDIGNGQVLYFIVQLDVAAAGAASETYSLALQTDDNSSFSSATTIATITIPKGSAAGTRFVIGFPNSNERYIRHLTTLADGGGTASVTLSAWFAKNPPPSWQAYPQRINT
jgi:hypothetical protein